MQPSDDQPRARKPLDREPAVPPRSTLAPVQGRVLDPGTAITVKGVDPRPTVYVGPRVLVSASVDFEGALEVLRAVARPLKWEVVPRPEDPRTAGLKYAVRAVDIRVASGEATIAPDGWTLLQQTRAQFGNDAVRGWGSSMSCSPATSRRTRSR
ncbi:hypothetical protein [Nocardioides ungokensis]|uniref:hypothetical protein n=1 Tax=Nocardioides ungokensis TaxID=1643322 RepID=UPI0015DFE38F|nr:hypothetical protein [Nocardioides ungokensis]